jgi:AraC-like DNA-binding protein
MDPGSPSLPLPSVSVTLLVVVASLAVAAAAIVAALVLVRRAGRRHARQLAEVVERLERLEQRGLLAAPVASAAADDAVDREPGASSADTPSGDVLAGMTSHVRRMVEDEDADPVTFADEAIVCIYRHLDEPFAPRALAAELCVSLRSLERGLVAGLGCTPRELIRAVKMREARRLLAAGRLNVAEVASRTGFASPFHFSRSFKGFFGISPSQVRPVRQEATRARRA